MSSITVYVTHAINESHGDYTYALQVESSEAPGEWVNAMTTGSSGTSVSVGKSFTAVNLPNTEGVSYRFRSSVSSSPSSQTSEGEMSSSWSSASLYMRLKSLTPQQPSPPVISELEINSMKLTWLDNSYSSDIRQDNFSPILEHEIQMRQLPNGYFQSLPSTSTLEPTIVKSLNSAMETSSQVIQISIQCDVESNVNYGEYWLSVTTATHISNDALVNNTREKLNGFGSSSSFSDIDPSRRSVTQLAINYDATAEEVREGIQGLVGMETSSVHVVRMSPSLSGGGRTSTSNQESYNGAFSWRVTIKPPLTSSYSSGAHSSSAYSSSSASSWHPPKLAVLKNTISECIRNLESNRDILRTLSDGRTCYSVYTGSGPVVKVETIQTGKVASLNSNSQSNNLQEEEGNMLSLIHI